MRIHVVLHESFEGPGAILEWAEKNSCSVSFTKLYQGEELPISPRDLDFLIVMGGPQSPETTLNQCPHFDAQKEIEFIQTALLADKKVLGVCLGAQLIGEALGAKFEHSPNKEIGVFEITMTEESKSDPLFSTFGNHFPVGHWHGDMPGLTVESKILAFSEGCPRQIVKYSQKVYGFQCHFEFTPDSIDGMIQNSLEELETYKNLPYIQDSQMLRSYNFTGMNQKLFQFLDYMESI